MQRDGCSAHRFIPSLLSRWAELIDANDALNVARYRNTLTGNEFENGEWSSVEIHAATDKRAIGDAGVNQWRQEFDAKVVSSPDLYWQTIKDGRRQLRDQNRSSGVLFVAQTQENIALAEQQGNREWMANDGT
jgi:hypothetical protein